MDFRNTSALTQRADHAIAGAAVDPKRLVLLYSGASAVVMLIVTVANFLLQAQIAGTGGLSGLVMRSMLETAIQVLQLSVNLLLPFWTFGYLSCVLHMTREQPLSLQTMLDGFRRFGPVLRLNLLRSGYLLLMALLCIYPSMMIFLWTPLSTPFMEIIEPLMAVDAAEILLDDATLAAATDALLPSFLIYGVLLLALAGPKYYSFRMADYCLMDDPRGSALIALRRSSLMLHKNRLALLKLDLHFWWFYLLDGLTLLLCYGETLLPLVGIQLPITPEIAYFLFYALYLGAQIGLSVWARNKVECTYAAGYECLKQDIDKKLQQIMAQRTQNTNPQDV